MTGAADAGPSEAVLGDHVHSQLTALGNVVGLAASDTAAYGRVLLDALGDSAHRPLSLPPASPSFISDDHTPVEFSLAFTPGAAPVLRMLVEPGWDSADMGGSGRAGLEVLREWAGRWNFSTDRLDTLEDLFFPAAAEGPFAVWYALELRPGGVPGVKVYLNPSAGGAGHAARTVREALRRLGHRGAFAALPEAAGYPFFALDLGSWAMPRVKVYVRHTRLSTDHARVLSRAYSDLAGGQTKAFFQRATEPAPALGRETDGREPLRRPPLTTHSFTDSGTGTASGFTLHIPVRDYVHSDEEAHARATALLTDFGMDASVLTRALAALTPRELGDGVGLIAYLALAHQQHRQPRITAYVSSEAYAVRPPLTAHRPDEARTA
ncbi:tryptophan dimethylallyltransferase family protein [Streptomyces sp. NPDC059785]|uniref:tryptophan dimethylallyltransferase family protein n=1 Tax=Streptomyces sp. NPDC059785 TaxID=3346945 RepID=UPI00364C2421